LPSSSSSSFALRWSLLALAVSASAAVACGGDGATTATGAPEPAGAGGSTAAPSGEAGSSGASTGDAGSAGNTDAGAAGAAATSEDDLKANDPGVGFTADFRTYLGTLEGDLGTADVSGPAGYGGRTKAGQKLKHKPLILVHGNSDQAVGGKLGGWSGVIDGFKKAGYTSAEIYAVSWGPADSYQAVYQYHSRAYLERIRGFIQAVLAYTGADKADVVGHSMGVTLARKAIVGGGASDALGGGSYDLGPALTDRVDTFVGIAGGNLGLSTCYFTGPSTPTCGATNGFYPGTAPGGFGLSLFLAELLEHPHEEAGWTGSIWSPDDEILGTGSLTWGVVTARLPEQDGEVVLAGKKHIDLKNAAIPALLQAVSTHTFPAP
jgi:hypothetical protein